MTHQATNSASVLAAMTQYMDSRSLRKTPERFAIAEHAVKMGPHFSADSLHESMESEGYHVSRATVYNTILLLEDAGIVRRRNFAVRPAQYEFVAGTSGHFHLVCSQCGKVREFRDAEIESILSRKRFGSFHPHYTDLNIFGLCSQCSRLGKQHNMSKP